MERRELVCPVCNKKMKQKPTEWEDFVNCDYFVCLDGTHKVAVTIKV